MRLPGCTVGHCRTPGYWAPEQARGERVTAACDIFAWGIMARRLLRGTGVDVPSSYRRVIDKALRHEPAHRYTSGVELREALRVVSSRPNFYRYVFIALGTLFVVSAGSRVDAFAKTASPLLRRCTIGHRNREHGRSTQFS